MDLHLITISQSASTELHASGATIVVEVTGQSFFTGSEAFKKAEEVAKLIAELKVCGLGDEDVRLQHVTTRVESGLLTKSSEVRYVLQIDCPSMDQLGPVLAAISSQKNCATRRLEWSYEDLEKSQSELTRKAVRAAHSEARLVAETLGVRLLGVHELSLNTHREDERPTIQTLGEFEASPRRQRLKASSVALEELGLAHSTKLTVQANGRFIVDTFDGSGEPSAV